MSSQRKTAEAVVAAFNAMDIDAIISHRSPDCLRYFLPSSMAFTPQDNATYGRSIQQLKSIFSNFSLTVDDVVEDKEARTICLWMTARADTLAGLYLNEYVWLLSFDATGTRIKRSKEYSDSIQAKEFYPKLQAAMKKHREEAATAVAEKSQETPIPIANGAGSFTVTLAAGQYYPVRIMFAQAQGGAVFDLTVTAPDGTTFLSSNSGGSPYIVQYSCHGTTAPAYSSFGFET